MSARVRALLVVALLPGCGRSSRSAPPSSPKDAAAVDASLASGLFWAEPLPVREQGTIEVAVSGDGSVGVIAWGAVDSSGEQVVLGQRPAASGSSELGVFAVRDVDGKVWVRLAESNLFPLGLELIDGVLVTGAGAGVHSSRFTWKGGPEWSAALATTTKVLRIGPEPQDDAVLAFKGATHERDASYVAETFGSIGDRVFAGVSHMDPGRRIVAWEGTVQAWMVDFPRSKPESELWGTELAGNEVVACLAVIGDQLKLDGLPPMTLSGTQESVAVWFSADSGRAVAARPLKRRGSAMESCSGFTAVQSGAIAIEIEDGEVQLFRRDGSPPETLGSLGWLGPRRLAVLETDGVDQIVTADVQEEDVGVETWRVPEEQWTVQVFDVTRRTVSWSKTFPPGVKILSLAIHGDVLAIGGERRSEFEIEPGVMLTDPTGGNRGFVAAYRLPPRPAK